MRQSPQVGSLLASIRKVAKVEFGSFDDCTKGAGLLFLNVVSFFLLSLIAFRRNSPYLFYGSDGRFEVTLITQHSLFVPPILALTNNFIHGLGNVWFPFNPWFIPSYFLALSEPGVFTNFALAYAISATELFIATYLTARLADTSRLVALIAAWVLLLLTFRYVEWHKIPTTMSNFPHYATIVGLSAATASSLLRIQRSRLGLSIAIACFFFLALSYIVVVAPTLLILAAPQFVVFAASSVLSVLDRREMLFKLVLLGAVLVACILAGYAQFVAGLVFYTAAHVFEGLSLRPASLQEVSLLFWTPVPPLFSIERSFVSLGLLGAAWAAWRSAGVQRLTAIAFLVTASVILVVGLVHFHYRFWVGPAFWYFEGFLFPFHATFAAFAACDVIRIVLRLVVQFLGPARLQRADLNKRMVRVAALLIAGVSWIYVCHEQRIAPASDIPYYVPYPETETPITKIIKDEIALKPGDAFRGRVATLIGRIFSESTNVDVVGLWGFQRVLATEATGNSHDAAGFWQDSVPTLLEYNPLITPPYFAFARSFFTEPADLQIRNEVAMRRIDPRLLAAVGVRFVVTDRPFDSELRLRQVLEVPVSEAYLKRAGIPRQIPTFKLYLYQLNGVNVGQYSPTEPRVVRRASEMLDVLGDPVVDLMRTFVVSENMPGGLSAATLREFLIERGQFTVRATTAGRSVLVLPMEYSRCLDLVTRPAGSHAQLFRANLLMTGIIFEGDLDVTIFYRTGPFMASGCRLRDTDDMKAIEMALAFRNKPYLAPTGIVIN